MIYIIILHRYNNYIKCTVINSIETYVYWLSQICKLSMTTVNLKTKKIYNIDHITDTNAYKFYECCYYTNIGSANLYNSTGNFPQIAYAKLRLDNLLLLLNNFVKLESLIFFINRKLVL